MTLATNNRTLAVNNNILNFFWEKKKKKRKNKPAGVSYVLIFHPLFLPLNRLHITQINTTNKDYLLYKGHRNKLVKLI